MRTELLTSIIICILCITSLATVTFQENQNPNRGPDRQYTITVTPTPGDYNETDTSDIEFWGTLERITIAATGTETDFTVTLADEDAITLFTKTDCNTVLLPLSYTFYQDDTEGNPHDGFIIAGPITVTIQDVNYSAEVQTIVPDTNATAGPWSLTYAGQTTAAVNEVVTISEVNDPNLGTFTLSFGGQTTGALSYASTAEQIDTALEALSTIAENEVACTGGPLPDTPVVVTFDNGLGSQNVGAVTFTDVNLAAEDANLGALFDITVTTAGQGLVYDSNIVEIQEAIDALSNVESGDITVSGGPMSEDSNDLVLTFDAALGNVGAVTIGSTYLTGPTTITVTQTTRGGSDLSAINITLYSDEPRY